MKLELVLEGTNENQKFVLFLYLLHKINTLFPKDTIANLLTYQEIYYTVYNMINAGLNC